MVLVAGLLNKIRDSSIVFWWSSYSLSLTLRLPIFPLFKFDEQPHSEELDPVNRPEIKKRLNRGYATCYKCVHINCQFPRKIILLVFKSLQGISGPVNSHLSVGCRNF